MSISPRDGQICVDNIICGSPKELFVTFIALIIIYIGYKYLYKK